MKASFVLTLFLALALASFNEFPGIPVNSSVPTDRNLDITVDTHEDTPQRFLDENYDIGSTDSHDRDFISLEKARAGDLGAVFFSIWAYPTKYEGHFAKRTLDLIDSVYAQTERHPDRMMMCFSVDDIQRTHEQHKL